MWFTPSGTLRFQLEPRPLPAHHFPDSLDLMTCYQIPGVVLPRVMKLVAKQQKMASTRTETQTSTAGKSSGPAKLNKDPTIAQIFESLDYGPAPEAASSVNSWLDEHGRDFGHFVNGKWVKPEGRKVYETRNPATGQ